jgi:hypothetical protein
MLQSHYCSGILRGGHSRFRRGRLQLLRDSVSSMYHRISKANIRVIPRGCVDEPMDESLLA